MKSKKPILKKILIVFVSFIGIIGLLIGGFFLKSNIFSNNYSGKTLEKHLEVETDGNETPLKAIGKGLYDKNGDLITLKGINFGNWLIQEGWLSTTSLGYLKNDKGEPKEVNENGIITGYEEVYQEELIEALKNNKNLTQEQVNTLWNVYYSSYIQEQDYINVKEMGFNCIRLPMYYRNFMEGEDDNLVMKDNAFDILDDFLENCKNNNLYAILDMHGVVGGANGYEHSGTRKFDFWKNEIYQNEMILLWENIAKHYIQDRPDLIETIATYDIINEPCKEGSRNTEKEQWVIMDKIYQAIRKIDNKHVITFEGCWYYSSFPNPKDYGWDNVMYEIHLYNWTSISYDLFFAFHDFLFSFHDYDVPYYVGEFNFFDNEDQWVKWLNMFDERNYSWTVWTYKMASVGYWDNSWGLYVYKMNLTKDQEKLNLRTATYEEIYQEWSTQATDYKNDDGSDKYSTGVMKRALDKYFNQKKEI